MMITSNLIYLIFIIIHTIVMIKEGYTAKDWQYWVMLLCILGVRLSSVQI